MKFEQSRTSQQFFRRMALLSLVMSGASVVTISLYLASLLTLPSEQWVGFGQIVASLFCVLFVASSLQMRRIYADCLVHLDARESGGASREQVEAAYRCLLLLPRRMVLSSTLWWVAGGVLVSGCMWLRYEEFGAFAIAVMVAASATGGFVSSLFIYFWTKRVYRADLEDLATQVGSVAARRKLADSLAVSRKLAVSIAGVTAVAVLFSWLLAVARSSGALEANMVSIQSLYLDEVARELALGAQVTLGDAEDRAVRLGIASDFAVLDAETGELIHGGADLTSAELQAIVGTLERGDSLGLDSPNVLSWRLVEEEGEVIVAVLPRARVATVGDGGRLSFAAAVVGSVFIAFLLARALGWELGATARDLKAVVEAVAKGDLRGTQIVESDDEIGDLGRSFEMMRATLRETVGRVVEATDLVDDAAGDIAELSRNVSSAAVEQGGEVQRTAESMEGLSRQVAEIAKSSEELNLLVEESSSSILEMGAAGDELNDTATVLSGRVDEVSTAIEQMTHSTREVGETTGSLAAAAVDTSSSMEEMATAMRQVQANADETARLSQRVVEAADAGRAKVSQTIEGMESIRSATESAEDVIRGLAGRAREIGAILDVIDDVADETNLLALNAAIIAAQAGDHGRAFSVVADEIKELADRVLASTKEIGDLIGAVQDESTNAIEAIEKGARSVAAGVERATESGESLEVITRSSRESGLRIDEIVASVREQTRAAGHVVELMERVSAGVEAIQRASAEHENGNRAVFQSTLAMRDVAQQVKGTTEEQARGGARVRESISRVRDLVETINEALRVQSSSCAELTVFIEGVAERSRVADLSGREMEQATDGLRGQSRALRERVARFEV